ncbi:hypothetical protein MD484_g7275, partial [Candolleomyces efflorescens]
MQAPPLPPRSHTSHPRSQSHNPSVRRKHGGEPRVYEERVTHPWEDMAHTYAWVAEQEYNMNLKQSRKQGRNTEEWVFKQATYYPREDEVAIALTGRPHPPPAHPGPHRSGSLRRDPGPGAAPSAVPRRSPTQWEEVIYRYEVDAERWMRHEEESRRVAEERMRARARFEDELRRIDERVRLRREEQRRMFEESRARSIASMREHERRERTRLEKAISESWDKYESRWSELSSSSEPLTFDNIPWPTAFTPSKAEDLTASAITSFLLSGAHSQETSNKDRLRSAQLRWHPDRFRRLMNRVTDEEKEQVEAAVGVVARVLNELMQREKRSSK